VSGVGDRLRRGLARIGVRLFAFNVLLVFLPVAGMLFLGTYERHLLAAQERTMVQEGRLLAAALAAGGGADPARARAILLALGGRHTARLRVVDTAGRVLADSAALGPRAEPGARGGAGRPRPRPLLYRIGAAPFRLGRRLLRRGGRPLPPAYGDARVLNGPEVRAALSGRYGSATRIGTTGSVILYAALPVPGRGGPAGAVVVSRSTDRIRATLEAVRLRIFQVFLASVAAAALLSLVTAMTIVRPIARLRRRAEAMLDRRGRIRARFEPGARADEIGDLERALATLAGRLEEHVRFIESFAADLAHELKNPLAAVRSAAELARATRDPGQRERLLARIEADVRRIETLLADARELARIDARLEEEERETVPLVRLAENVAESLCLARGEGPGRIVVEAGPGPPSVEAAPHRLAEVLENILANALDFSPPGEPVRVTVRRDGPWAVVEVADRGPGIPVEHLDRIFTRFFSWRPEGDGDHTGLGLATVRAIVEGYGGTVSASNREGGGAVLAVRLPAVPGP